MMSQQVLIIDAHTCKEYWYIKHIMILYLSKAEGVDAGSTWKYDQREADGYRQYKTKLDGFSKDGRFKVN